GRDHPDVARSLYTLGELYHHVGERDAAERAYLRGVELSERTIGRDHFDTAATLAALAALRQGRGDIAGALAAQERVNEARERSLELVLTNGSEAQKQSFLERFRAETHTTASLHVRLAPSDARAVRLALRTILRRKGRVLDVLSATLAGLRARLGESD